MDMHMLIIDKVEWIEAPGHTDNYRIVGNLETIVEKVKQIQDTRTKNVSLFIEYCCDTCKEAVNGS